MNIDLDLRTGVHYFLHFVFPVFIALAFYGKDWKKAYLILLSTMLVDLDHLFATPIFDPSRSSVGFHFLHSYPAITLYVVGVIFSKKWMRLFFIGLLLHMITDFQDYHAWIVN